MMTRQQLCAHLRISESTVRRMELDGLPVLQVTRRTKRYDLVEVKRWMRERGCQHGSILAVAGMSASWSTGREFIESYRRRHLRVTPS